MKTAFTAAEILEVKGLTAKESKKFAEILGVSYKTKKDFVKLLSELKYDDSKVYDVCKHSFAITHADEVIMLSPRIELKNQTILRLSDNMVAGLFESGYIVGYINNLNQSTYY